MDEKAYIQNCDEDYLRHEAMCRRCGACCGILEGDPCEHLKKGIDEKYFCEIYSKRFGMRKTLSGEPVLCVPIRNILHKTWWGRSGCPYSRIYR